MLYCNIFTCCIQSCSVLPWNIFSTKRHHIVYSTTVSVDCEQIFLFIQRYCCSVGLLYKVSTPPNDSLGWMIQNRVSNRFGSCCLPFHSLGEKGIASSFKLKWYSTCLAHYSKCWTILKVALLWSYFKRGLLGSLLVCLLATAWHSGQSPIQTWSRDMIQAHDRGTSCRDIPRDTSKSHDLGYFLMPAW